jgi:pimeloyl-ACP methyl ester carboxylesterase
MCASLQQHGRQADNAADLVALRRALRADRVVYAGVSAGGLAALVAASLDIEATRGVLLLDPVNTGGPVFETTIQAKGAARQVQVPVAALIARPQVCNAWRNIDPALRTLAQATIVRIDGASHCDFEWPTDAFCRVACVSTGSGERRRRSESRIREIGLSFVRAVAAEDSEALQRWKGDIGAILN